MQQLPGRATAQHRQQPGRVPPGGSVKRIESNELKVARKRVNREADKFKDALGRVGKRCHLPVLEIAHYFVRLDQVASVIVNADHGIM